MCLLELSFSSDRTVTEAICKEEKRRGEQVGYSTRGSYRQERNIDMDVAWKRKAKEIYNLLLYYHDKKGYY